MQLHLRSPAVGLNELGGIILLQGTQNFMKMAQIKMVILVADRRTSETVTLLVLELTKHCFNTFKVKLLDSVLKCPLI